MVDPLGQTAGCGLDRGPDAGPPGRSAGCFQSCQESVVQGVTAGSLPGRATRPGLESLIFEPKGGSGSLAELTFGQPMADATVEVRGQLRLGDDTPRIEVALTWAVEKGRLLSFAADLPPGWTPDSVVSAARQPVPWHADPLASGGTRVHLAPSPADEPSRSVTLTLTASARQAGVTGPLDLPRVRPAAGARAVDEVWVATAESGLAIRPILGSGLAWLDPPLPAIDEVPTPWVGEDIERALAWARWLVDAPRPDRPDTAGSDPRGRGQARGHDPVEGASLSTGRSTSSRLAGTSTSSRSTSTSRSGGPILWKTRRGRGADHRVSARWMTPDGAGLGVPDDGPGLGPRSVGAFEGEGPGRSAGVEGPWAGRGRIPVLTLPERFKARGIAEVVVENSTRVNVDSTGLTPIVTSLPLGDPAASTDDAASSSDARLRKPGCYGYRSSGGRLVVETTEPRADPGRGLIREAFLVSQISPGAGMRHRLTLGIATDSARSLALTMPGGATIDRFRRDGLAVAPIPSGEHLLIEIPGPDTGRPLCTLTIDYRTDDDPLAGPIEPNRLLPMCSLPCLGFAWEFVAPETWVLEKTGRGLEVTDPQPGSSVAARLLGFQWSPWGNRNASHVAKAEEEMLRDLDRSATEIADGETNLGDWILKLDAGRWPLVLDRLAIRSSGWGPGSRIGSSPVGLKALGPVSSVLEPMGLVAVPLEGMILITSRDELPSRPEDRDAWSAAVHAVPSQDSDGTDRFQSAARWRGEATPRPLASGESPSLPSGRGGWHQWRVVSSGWPAPGASVSLIDERSDRAWGWFVASAVLVVGLLCRARPAMARALGLVAVGVVASVGLAWHWPESSSTCTGLLRGCLGVLVFWLGRSFRPAPFPTPTTRARSRRRAGGAD